tara:strand:- start:1971 stop:2165 length:195 start_codon:yes stop_codon:yes gene_type:complete
MEPSISIFASDFATRGKPEIFIIVKEYFDAGRSATRCSIIPKLYEKQGGAFEVTRYPSTICTIF